MSRLSPTDSATKPWPQLPLPVPDIDWTAAFSFRPWAASDAGALAAAWRDPEVVSWMSPPGADLATAKRWIDGEAQRRSAGLAVDLVVDIDGVAGEVGFSSFDADRRACLVGYWLVAAHRGQGLGARVVREACTWIREAVGVEVVVAECDPANQPSRRTVESAGFDLLAACHRGNRVYGFR